MRTRLGDLSESDRARLRAAIVFLNGRLEERATIDWALHLKADDKVTRLAVLEVIDSPGGEQIHEPWRSAWRLIEEFWNSPPVEESSIGAYDAQKRLSSGDRSGALVTKIVELVSPRLSVEPFSDVDLHFRKAPRRPKKVEDLLRTGLASGETVDPGVLKIGKLTDRRFLASLALALDAAVAKGLDIACRLGWRSEGSLWQLGGLYRVYYVPVAERDDEEEEPDVYHHGIAPSVKLLHTVVSRLASIDISAATQFVRRWKEMDSPIYLRLWAALSRDSHVTSPEEVGTALLSLRDRQFWDITGYPEIAELRARRFGDLDLHQQRAITARIRRLPPRSLWPRKADAGRVANIRLYWALRELRRIEVAGASLPPGDKTWLQTTIPSFPDLAQITRLDEGFMEVTAARAVPANPDSRFDLLAGEERLRELEAALSCPGNEWDDDPRGRANDWIQQPGRPTQILAELESVPHGGAAFTKVWDRFGWAHSPATKQIEGAVQRDPLAESGRVLSLLSKLPETTIRSAIEGISQWLSAWKDQVILLPQGLDAWLRVWPIAVEATNARRPSEEEFDLSTVLRPSSERQPKGPDTLNTPAGKLVGVFLAACPNLSKDDHPFSINSAPRTMRDAIIAAPGEAGLIARHRMIEALAYFLKADPTWTQKYLITPLTANNEEARTLWRAVARRRQSPKVLKIIGDAMTERATDRRLGREAQCSLAFTLVVECLHAFRGQREPAVARTRITQMLRSLDDEIRGAAAEAVQRFIRDNSTPHDEKQAPPSPEQLFRSGGAPFLQEVWPQERSLATPGVSKALADLPASTRDAFPEAVDAIERFLVPFECWSMLDYGFYGEEGGGLKLSSIDNQKKARALLRLLDLTVGRTEGSVIPHDLADALDQIRKISPKLIETREFRRLATAARWR